MAPCCDLPPSSRFRRCPIPRRPVFALVPVRWRRAPWRNTSPQPRGVAGAAVAVTTGRLSRRPLRAVRPEAQRGNGATRQRRSRWWRPAGLRDGFDSVTWGRRATRGLGSGKWVRQVEPRRGIVCYADTRWRKRRLSSGMLATGPGLPLIHSRNEEGENSEPGDVVWLSASCVFGQR